MGREAGTVRQRTCPICERPTYASAKDLKEHARLCKMAKGMGLVLPGIDLPSIKTKEISRKDRDWLKVTNLKG